MKKVLILNVGGTFNKMYNQITGQLEVASNNNAIQMILDTAFKGNIEYELKGMLFKDSLDMDDKDRQKILKAIEKYEKILIVHGTDTMHQTAQFLASFTHHQTIVLTGAMQPFNINSIEACCNFSLSWQFLNTTPKKGVFIGMHGLVLKHHKIFKNRKKGIFQCKK